MKTKARKVGLLLLLLFLAMASGACPVPADEFIGLTSAELAERMIDALQAVETVQVEIEMSHELKHMDKLTGEIAKEIATTTSATRVYDMVNNRMREETWTTGYWARKGIVSHIEEVIEEVRVRYFVDGFIYLIHIETNGRWVKDEAPWQAIIPTTEATIRWLKVSKAEVLRTERVRGINCFVVSLQPDVELYWQEKVRMLEEIDFDPEAEEVLAVRETLEAKFREMTLKQWVAKDTFLPVKQLLKWSISSIYEGLEGAMSHHETTYYQFNQRLTIELPPEAAEAVMFEPPPVRPRE